MTIRKYQKGNFLGKGGFAQCYEFTNMESKKIFAAKIIAKESLQKSRARQQLYNEIKIHRMLKHENIVDFIEVFEDKTNVYLLLELCSFGTLKDYMKQSYLKILPEAEVKIFTHQLVSGLIYLHSKSVIHRDLKNGNLFLNHSKHLKIGDFGLSAGLEF